MLGKPSVTELYPSTQVQFRPLGKDTALDDSREGPGIQNLQTRNQLLMMVVYSFIKLSQSLSCIRPCAEPQAMQTGKQLQPHTLGLTVLGGNRPVINKGWRQRPST